MTPITHENIHCFCRTCLAELTEKSSLMGEKYSIQEDNILEELITLCTPLPLEDDIKYPDFVCRTCYEKLQSIYDFRCQTMKSLCALRNIIKEFSQKKASEEQCRGLDSDQGSEENFENKEWKNTVEFHENKSSREVAANTVIKIQQDPTDYTIGLVLKSESREEICEEIEEKEIDISEVKVESTCDADALDFLGSSFRNSPNAQNAEVSLEFLDISIQVSPGLKESTIHANCGKLNEDCTDSSAGSSTKDKGRNSACPDIKNSVKGTNNLNLAKRLAKSQSENVKGSSVKFQCDQCPRRCITWENYEAHLRTHQGLKPFLCKECGRSFNKAYHCQEHVRKLHPPVALQYTCSYEGCGKVFKREGAYQMHCSLKHKYSDGEHAKFMCEECGSTFRNATRFKEHRLSHVPVEEYPFKCEECGKRFRSKSIFKEHKLRHSGVKNYICPHCGTKKTTHQELQRHINSHTQEKQFPCPNCKSVFTSSGNLSRHNSIVHKGIRFACKYCNQSFPKRETLKHHEMRHTGERPHGCDICGKRFIQNVALRAHMKVHNKGCERSLSNLPVNEKVVTPVEKTGEI